MNARVDEEHIARIVEKECHEESYFADLVVRALRIGSPASMVVGRGDDF